jgi:V-type H+-transporting ATPase subunit d
MNHGFLEGILRGYYLGLISQSDYQNLTQCEKLEDMKLHLQGTSYGDFLANEPLPLHSTTIAEKCTAKMVEQFNYLRVNSVQPLSEFLDYITYSYMIDNIVLLITGTIRESNTQELKSKCHPLGLFKKGFENDSIMISQNVSDLYNEVLIDTPLGPYIQGCLSENDLDEMHVEIIRNTLYKAYLEDFYKYCTETLGGETGEVMSRLLKFEADRRCINITLNSIGTELTSDDRKNLFPTIGHLYPEATELLMVAENEDAVKQAVAPFPQYSALFDAIGFDEDKSLEDSFFEMEVKLNLESFESQFSYGCFYSYFKLKEQEIRNILWIAECILQDQKNEVNRYIVIK